MEDRDFSSALYTKVSKRRGLKGPRRIGVSSSPLIKEAKLLPINGPHVIPHGPPPVATNTFSNNFPTTGSPSGDIGRIHACVSTDCSVEGVPVTHGRSYPAACRLACAADARAKSGLQGIVGDGLSLLLMRRVLMT